ncbi:MAG: papain-like cysteine protease family protein [Microvirga sp.]
MAFPQFLQPHTVIAPGAASREAASAGARAEAAAAGRPQSGKLVFSIQKQLQTQWCWAAVSTSVSLYFNRSSTWTQCTVANTNLKRSDCCGSPSNCNTPSVLEVPLKITGNLRTMMDRRLSLNEVQGEISGNSPVCARIAWHGGGGHFVVVSGWLVAADPDESQYLYISDPIYLDSRVALDEFPSAYQGGGDWTHTYLTDRPRVALAAADVEEAFTAEYPNAIGA